MTLSALLGDMIAYRPFIDALKAIGYDGRVSCEAYSNNFYEDAVQAVKFFKDNF